VHAEAVLALQARNRDVALTVLHCDPDVAVHADADRLHRILTNLLSNAVKFTEPGGRVEIGCVRADDRVRIEVRDTGVGIPADKLEAIFEPFVQLRSELTRTAEGTGLGLSISRALARCMHGDLTVESTPGAVSTFTLTLMPD
jgi:signal transduction histidine kinase